ncbi:MAG: hypothetical protein LBQ39_00500 [Tannerellaceae bacterium]|jgi:hypothetical protein|nr:hypothetical protein [Tannerellaceae bacterium]
MKSYKKTVGKCENKKCGRTDALEIAHRTGMERPKIIANILEDFVNGDGLISVDLEEFRKLFLDAHKPYEEKVKILCSKCHIEYDKANDASIIEEIKNEDYVEQKRFLSDECENSNNKKEKLPIEYEPIDKDEFKNSILESKEAVLHYYLKNGKDYFKIWNASKLSESSDIKQNVRSRTELRQGTWQKLGIIKVKVIVE